MKNESIDMLQIGRVVRLQVQHASLKVGRRPNSYYDPAAIVVVERLRMTPAGCVGITAGGEEIVDVHSLEHPESKSRQASNALSVGFTSHYAAMRNRFGSHLVDGIAGENILIETERPIALDDLADMLVVQGQNGQFALSSLLVADPCVEFSHFTHLAADPLTPDELRATLQFLGDGMRGFYAQLAGGLEQAEIRIGDRVFAAG